MKLTGDLLLAVCLAYVAALFIVAALVDRAASEGRMKWLQSPLVYTLSISVYCTSWTFYGAVGSAVRNGLEFITIYLGPTLVFIGWFWLLRKLVRIGREHRITSIADLISSRYGKSPSLAVLVTLIAVIATTPYIALQLQSVTRSYEVIAGESNATVTAFWVAAGMVLFTILFGTRNLDANERHHGVVAAIAIEAVVKLFALIAIGVFVVLTAGGVGEIFSDVPNELVYGGEEIFGPRWVIITFLSATAIICLPRQFQVTVVENVDERHLATASWLFPAYLFGMSLFIVPIAIYGLKTMPADANPDLYVLTLPLTEGRSDIALLAFIGGFSSATSMVIVAAIAVSTMVSNHIVMPIALRFLSPGQEVSGDVRNLLLISRRLSIGAILGLGFLYFHLSGGSDALAAIGLIAFAGVAQFLPALLGGVFWRGATAAGALCGLILGALLWAYTLFLPSFDGTFLMPNEMIQNGPWGIAALRPENLFGLTGFDPLVHAMIWSLGVNVLVFLVVSVMSEHKPLERLQATLFVDIFGTTAGSHPTVTFGSANTEDLFILAQRILGTEDARVLFDEMSLRQGQPGKLPIPTDEMITRLERQLAGSIGAASAHAMISRLTGQAPLSMNELIDIADETQRLIETSRALSEKTDELERAANQLQIANDRLRALDAQKDDFLSQVSHELRTPMTSIRSFSEILLGKEAVSPEDRTKFIEIINGESIRLTGLLDEILDLSGLEAGGTDIPCQPLRIADSVQAAIATVSGMAKARASTITMTGDAGLTAYANDDRLRQVLINLLTNALKYNAAHDPSVEVALGRSDRYITIDVIDNGGGINAGEAQNVFEKFSRGERSGMDQGAGLGLPISRAIARAMNGELSVRFNTDKTSFFRVSLASVEISQAAE
ncbi:MAG: sensor histidine kinase [Pseudomonadota bacterium]